LDAAFGIERLVTSVIYRILSDASFKCEKSDRETLSPDAGKRSRAIIAGDDPGDQQLPERPGFNPHLLAIAANARIRHSRDRAGAA
jgi:hypothetical protein